jgi:type IV fimbrial biogenesis protein FimT
MFKHQGLSLLELLFSLALLMTILGLAVPSFRDMIAAQRALTAMHSLRGALNYARERAVLSGVPVSIAAAQGDWAKGWSLFHDRNNDGIRQAHEQPLAVYEPLQDVEVRPDSTSRTYIHYRPNGISVQPNGAFHAGHLLLCARHRTSYKLLINRTGRIRTESGETASLCPP